MSGGYQSNALLHLQKLLHTARFHNNMSPTAPRIFCPSRANVASLQIEGLHG